MRSAAVTRVKPWLIALLVLLSMTGLTALGWALATTFQSPDQREAQARAPRPNSIYESVERGQLDDSASGSGTVRYEASATLVPTELPPNAVVTRSPARKNSVAANGTVITELNGRPILALRGAFDFYRDLQIRDRGPDVSQFQAALRDLGYSLEVDGVFGPTTLAAAKRLYDSRGYDLAGRSVPLTELIAVPGLPATITSALAVGDHPDPEQGVGQVSSGDLIVIVDVDGAVGARLKTSTSTSLAVDGEARMVRGRIDRMRDKPDGMTEVVIVSDRPLPRKAVGSPVVAQFFFTRVARDALLVPSRAVALDAGGSASVLVKRGTSDEKVAVSVLGELAGTTALSRQGELRESDQVRVD